MSKTNMTPEKALTGFGSGISCAMAVFGELAPELGLDELTAKKIAAGFGSGLGNGGTCGCVTGALMALGLKYGNCVPGDMEQAAIFKAKRAEFEQKFTEKYGSLVCAEILGGINPTVPEDKEVMLKEGLMPKICAPAVCTACEILKEMFDAE